MLHRNNHLGKVVHPMTSEYDVRLPLDLQGECIDDGEAVRMPLVFEAAEFDPARLIPTEANLGEEAKKMKSKMVFESCNLDRSMREWVKKDNEMWSADQLGILRSICVIVSAIKFQ